MNGAANFLRQLVDPDDMTIGEAKALAKKHFGDSMNVFKTAGLWHVGRFLDSGWTTNPLTGERTEMPPYQRDEEIFGVGPTLREALRFLTDARRIYSGAGMAPGASNRTGYRPVWDNRGRLRGYNTPQGIFCRNFPRREGTS